MTTKIVTAKVVCAANDVSGEGESRNGVVRFAPDYADGRNKEWAIYTPHLVLQMALNGAVADHFKAGKRYTLQIVEDED